ncbi:hypothetical protein ACFQ1E_05905 [Sphingomonas canadensis]|uniref:Uncharacterized protein n=1 Tax=Sphingomonas canadensis TaxID=1219257 RepID=A0ABW3H3X3_9SPHN|nr:hypothetical protein [Sphingomonas canadensis]MCW3835676.1 hypothetical protein [Sphingomonas canadensis]
MRPKSVVLAERLYFAAWLLSAFLDIYSLWTRWDMLQRSLDLQTVGLAPAIVGGVLVALLYLGLLYLAVRMRSNLARWLLAIHALVLIVLALGNFYAGALAAGLPGVLMLAITLLRGFAVSRLFLRDAAAWYAGRYTPSSVSAA